MKKQPNDIVTLEWLSPLLNQQLSQISTGWQSGADIASYAQMTSHYHQISGALTMISLPLLSDLAHKLSLLASLGGRDDFTTRVCQIGQFSHQLLQRELNQYARTGNYNTTLVNNATNELTQVLSQRGIETDVFTGAAQYEHLNNDSHDDIITSIEVAVPISQVTTSLEEHHYQQLLLVWRQQVEKLLVANANHISVLQVLEKVRCVRGVYYIGSR